MKPVTQQTLPYEIQLGTIRIAGYGPTQVLARIKAFAEARATSVPALAAGATVQALLDPSALELVSGTPKAGAVLVLNLEHAELACASEGHRGPISWFCSQDPKKLLGQLLDGYRGTYYRAHRHELVYAGDFGNEVYRLRLGTQITPELLAAVCIAREAGISENAIRKALEWGASEKSETRLSLEHGLAL